MAPQRFMQRYDWLYGWKSPALEREPA
jgi:hypothetical protein